MSWFEIDEIKWFEKTKLAVLNKFYSWNHKNTNKIGPWVKSEIIRRSFLTHVAGWDTPIVKVSLCRTGYDDKDHGAQIHRGKYVIHARRLLNANAQNDFFGKRNGCFILNHIAIRSKVP